MGSRAEDFEATIVQLERTDPVSPALLNVRLNYAEFLLSGAPDSCASRLERAQEQLGSADASPEARVIFPDGWARAAALEYRMHLARAACVPQTDRKDELLAAIAAARRAVEFYRNAFDYRSMVNLQFDAGIALHRLGEHAAALAALESAIDMDREYGFRDDAAQNYELLLTWRGRPAGPAQVAALMQHFPKRRTILKFGWHALDAQITLGSHRVRLDGGQIMQSRAAATLERRISADHGGWSVSYAHPLTRYEPGVWPTMQEPQMPKTVFPPTLLPPTDFKVKATGEFEAATNSDAFAAQLATKTAGLVRARAPSGDRDRNLTQEAVETTTDFLAPWMLEAETAQNYSLETSMWIGATLEQGVWYELSAPLFLSGMAGVVIPYRIEFAFTRWVPCNEGETDRRCVEIVIHATPDEAALDDVIADMRAQYPRSRSVQYVASTAIRIVTDPRTLLPYAREERTYWYASVGAGKEDSLLESEHLLSTTLYGADESRPH